MNGLRQLHGCADGWDNDAGYASRLRSLPSFRTRASTSRTESSAAYLLDLAVGTAKREGLPRELVRAFPLVHTADYLLRRTPLYSAALDARFNEWNSLSFDGWTRRVIEPCDAFIAISGAGLTTGPKVQAEGGKFICDRGSTHQRFQDQVLAEEYRRWGVLYTPPAAHIVRREEAIYEAADAITVRSNVARRSFLALGVPAEKVHVIPYGVRLDRFQPQEAAARRYLRDAIRRTDQSAQGYPLPARGVCSSAASEEAAYGGGEFTGRDSPVACQVADGSRDLYGCIPQTDLASRMSRSDVLALPSVEEGLALVQGQAMACGCPVVATVATGAGDLFADGVEGFIVADRDTDALVNRLQALADDPALRARMSAAALERVKTLGGWDHYGDLWDGLLHDLTGKPEDPSWPRIDLPWRRR